MRCYTSHMMDREEQYRISDLLETLSNEQIMELWDRLGVRLVPPATREDALSGEKHLIIGPLIADIDGPTLERAIKAIKGL